MKRRDFLNRITCAALAGTSLSGITNQFHNLFNLAGRVGNIPTSKMAMRRTLEAITLGGAAGCTGVTFNPEEVNQNPKNYVDGFTKWFMSGTRNLQDSKRGIHKLYNPPSQGVRMTHDWRSPPRHVGGSPGQAYDIRSGINMIAMMPGRVIAKGRYNTNRTSGGYSDQYVQIQAPDKISRGMTIEYGHLGIVKVKEGQFIERGQPIGRGTIHHDISKIMLYEGQFRDAWGLHEDPKNYGENHESLKLFSELSNETISKYPLSNLLERRKNQRQIMIALANKVNIPGIKSSRRYFRKNHSHFKGYKKAVSWSTIEEFRFLETLYVFNPGLFTNLAKKEFEETKSEFYENQPFLLNLPIPR